MPRNASRRRKRESHWLAALALVVAVGVSVATVMSVRAAAGPTPIEAAGLRLPTSSSNAPETLERQYTGFGDETFTITLPDGADQLAVASISHSGAGVFAVTGITRTGAPREVLVNTVGPYTGTVVFNRDKDGVTALRVATDDAWVVTLVPVRRVPTFINDAASGYGDSVLIYQGRAGSASVTNVGLGHFELIKFGAQSHLIVHAHDAFSGQVRWDAGPKLLSIRAEGRWSIRVHPS